MGARFEVRVRSAKTGRLVREGVPSDNLIRGMGLQTTDTKAQDGQQHPGSDALEITPSINSRICPVPRGGPGSPTVGRW